MVRVVWLVEREMCIVARVVALVMRARRCMMREMGEMWTAAVMWSRLMRVFSSGRLG